MAITVARVTLTDEAATVRNPARNFYHRLGMQHLGGWLRYGAGGDALRRLAAEDVADLEP